MIKEEAKQAIVYAYQELPLPKFLEVIDQIFNDHEAVIKAKEEEIERLRLELKHYTELANDLDNELRNTQWELGDLKDTK